VDEPGLSIIPYQPEHEAAVIRLWHDCDLTRPWNDPAKDIARKVAISPELFLVGLEDGRVIATTMGGYDGHRGWVYYLGVHPGHQRRGYGRLMMDAIGAKLAALGCPKINLQVRDDNEVARKFYESIGFRPDPVFAMGKRLVEDG
jgi:ribosomal protein S18 acetylase RimI-like enzyme